jgi:hypothetical protein
VLHHRNAVQETNVCLHGISQASEQGATGIRRNRVPRG